MALANRVPPAREALCSIGKLEKQLADQPSEAEALRLMLYGASGWGWASTDIWSVLRDEGYEVSLQGINRHRGNKCGCAR